VTAARWWLPPARMHMLWARPGSTGASPGHSSTSSSSSSSLSSRRIQPGKQTTQRATSVIRSTISS
jgi:hypothetical protein